MSSNFITNNIPVGIGYDSDGNAKGLVELPTVKLLHSDVTENGDYLVLSNDRIIYAYPTISNSITVTLPAAAISEDRVITVVNIGAGSVTAEPASGETINGISSFAMPVKYNSVTLHCNGLEWISFK